MVIIFRNISRPLVRALTESGGQPVGRSLAGRLVDWTGCSLVIFVAFIFLMFAHAPCDVSGLWYVRRTTVGHDPPLRPLLGVPPREPSAGELPEPVTHHQAVRLDGPAEERGGERAALFETGKAGRR
jgi:hypothetical protein